MATPFPVVLADLAAAAPDAPAVTDAGGTLTRGELDRRSNQWARALEARGVREGDIVSICLPSDARFMIAAWAVWKLGATPQPLSSRMVGHELAEVVALTQPSLVIAEGSVVEGVPTWDLSSADDLSDAPVPMRMSACWKAPTSGGSTGRPKVILAATPADADSVLALAAVLRMRPDEVALIPAPLHHNGPFLVTSAAMLHGGHDVLMPRFDPARALELIAGHRVGLIYAVPTIMSRIAKLPAEVTAAADLSSVHTLFHMAAPCADWLKRWWIDRIGADAVWELYAGTEAQAITVISGTEWLDRPGSVGRPVIGEISVLDEDGAPVAAGEVGEIFMRSTTGPTYTYLGGTARVRDGWESLGDLGWLDADGYLYLSDRKSDMVLVGGVNVYPAEVESALDGHPLVASSCVVGLPDEDLGNVLHAVVQLTGPLDDDELAAYLAERLAPHKRPRTFERSDEPLRDEAGKVRRSAVRAACLERVSA
jgi:bile acid-coenzyme A ligase